MTRKVAMKGREREKIRVLCIDDEPELLDIMKLYLEKDGDFAVNCVTSPIQALQIINKGGGEKYDAIVSDYEMPEMNGIELLKEIRSSGLMTPFIIFTGKGREEVVIDALNFGADGYVRKGGDPRAQFAELLNMIKTVVEKRRALEMLEVSERALAEAQTVGRIGNFIYDIAENELSVSVELLRILGLDKMPFTGEYEHLFNTAVHPDDRERVRQTLVEAIKKGSECEIEYRVILPDRTEKIVRHRTLTILGRDGSPAKVIGVIRDMTDEAHLFMRLERLNSMLFALRRVNQLIAREKDQGNLLRSLCNDLLRTRMFEGIVIAAKGSDGSMDLYYAVTNETHEEILRRMSSVENLTCIRDAMSTRSVIIFQQGDNRCSGCPIVHHDQWIDIAKRIEWGGEVYGTVLLHLHANAVVDEEVDFISDLTEDIGYALYNLKMERMKRNAEELLTRSERRYRHFFERANDGFAILQNGIVRYANRRLMEMGNYEENEVIGKHFAEFIADEDRERVLDYYRRRLAGKEAPTIYEIRLKKKDGSILIAELNATLAENEGGLATYVIVRDVTERVKMRELLEESERKYRSLFETTGTAMVMIEEDMTISLVNDEFTKLTGYTREEIEGKMKSIDFVSEKEVQRITEYHYARRSDASKAPRTYELELKCKDGGIRFVRITIDVIPGTKRSVASLIDITEEKKLKEELIRQREEFELLLDSIDTMVWYAIDPETYGRANKARAEFLGKKKEEIEGKKIWEFLPKPEAEVGVKGNRIVFEEKKKYRDFEWVTNAKGEKRLMLVTKIPKFDKDGNVEFAACTAEDVTELRKTQDALTLANKKLYLLGSVTRHDIMNQLAVISGSLQLLADLVNDEKSKRFVSMALKAAMNIEKHLEFSKDYERMGTYPPEWINLKEAIEKAMATIDRTKADIEVQIDDDLEVYADRLLEKVFSNIFDNALKHGGEKLSTIRIHQERRNDDLVIICEDDGKGLEESLKKSIFEGRHGRGLYLAKEILSMTGMTIEERGEAGRGARFEITVPKGGYRFGKE